MFKRLTLINTTFGDVDHHLGRFAAQASFQQAA
jgi:acyl-CoA dehydrogenase